MKFNKVIIGGDTVNKFLVSNNLPLVLFAGPCVIESRDHALEMSCALKEITVSLGINFVYKSSFDKANRTSIFSDRGLGLKRSIPILSEIREKYNIPVITDVHHPEDCFHVSKVVDILQIPAFLCRQTDLLISAAKTKKPLHIKKGQFLSPREMFNVIKKVEEFNNFNILLCERGFTFGYNNLISDMRSLPILRSTGYPVIFDATHSVQHPGVNVNGSGGERKFVEILSKAAVAVGVSGLFIETHENPDKAPSDSSSMIHLSKLKNLLKILIDFDKLSKESLDDVIL